jgi:hypothetical protein
VLLDAGRKRRRQSGLLQVGAVVTAGRESEGLKLFGGEECGDVFVAGGGSAAMERVVGEKSHVCVNFAVEGRRGRCRLHGASVE